MDDQSQKMRQFGQILRKARGRLTTYQVAKFAEISTSELNAVEIGEAWPTEYAWEKLAELFGMPIDMLSDMKRPPRKLVEISHKDSSQREAIAAEPVSNVVNFAAYQEKKWRQTSLFEKD